MKKLDVNLKVLIAIIALFGLTLSLSAQPGGQKQFHQRGHQGFAGLDLTEEQKTEVKAIHLAQMKETQPLMDEVKINKAKINAAIKKDDPDMKEIVSLVEANAKLMTDIQVKRIESRIKVREQLTDEQKVLFDAHAQKARKRKAIARHREAAGKERQRAYARHRF